MVFLNTASSFLCLDEVVFRINCLCLVDCFWLMLILLLIDGDVVLDAMPVLDVLEQVLGGSADL